MDSALANYSIGKDGFYNHVALTSDFPMGLEVAKAFGPYIHLTDGRKILDLISGIAVSSLGHGHPKVIQAIKDQVDKHLHVMVYGEFIQQPQSMFAKLLCENLPEGLDRIYLVNSGTEANEGALKLAKKYTGRQKLVGFKNSYHGDTHGALSVTGRDVYRDPFLPLLPDVAFGEFNNIDSLAIIDERTAAVILEPIQGEGGIIPADKNWLKAIRKRCTEVGAILIFDEIQSGFFRTGPFFAFMEYGVQPDILCIAKAMGGGMPIGGFVASHELFESFKKDPALCHVTTFGGHPVSCAAALANLQVLLEEEVGQKALAIEKMVKSTLIHPSVVEVRGKGAMLGMELISKDLTEKVVTTCLKEYDIMLGWTLHSNTLVRIAPPLLIEQTVLQEALMSILKVINEFSVPEL
jgi:acetylornithine/succinyldiaminopimelate/putrescine aminotransferase